MSDYAAKKKLPFLDMNLLEKELNMDWDRDSRDEGDHLNTYGAEKVSRYLGDYLKANYGLTDHRKGEKARYVYSALFCHLPDFTFSQDKIFGDPDEKGNKRNYPWYVKIQKVMDLVQFYGEDDGLRKVS